VRNFLKSGLSDGDLQLEVNTDSLTILTVEPGKFSKKDNAIIDSIPWVPGITNNFTRNGKTIFVNVKAVLKPEPKQLNEARGLITADYQNYLEQEWIKALRAKYPVVVKKEVLAKLK
jgi:peptidyl-prolyl cis-trans isomerase SurA